MKRIFQIVVVCSVALFSIQPANADADRVTESDVTVYDTPAGQFKGVYLSVRGVRHNILSTPVGTALQLYPFCWPDKECIRGGRATNAMVEGFTSIDETVFLVTTDGVWQWHPGLKRFSRDDYFWMDLYATDKFETQVGDVYGLIPDGGGMAFRGVLYFDTDENAWIRAEYYGNMVTKRNPRDATHTWQEEDICNQAEKITSVSDDILLIEHYEWSDDSPEITYYDLRTRSFINESGVIQAKVTVTKPKTKEQFLTDLE